MSFFLCFSNLLVLTQFSIIRHRRALVVLQKCFFYFSLCFSYSLPTVSKFCSTPNTSKKPVRFSGGGFIDNYSNETKSFRRQWYELKRSASAWNFFTAASVACVFMYASLHTSLCVQYVTLTTNIEKQRALAGCCETA